MALPRPPSPQAASASHARRMRHTRLTLAMWKRTAKLSCVSSDSFCIHLPNPLASVKGSAPS
eukprot:1470729-Prymnesium_polylepis.1